MNSFVTNELFLSTEYIRNHSLLYTGSVCVEGDSLICDYLKNTAKSLGLSLSDQDYNEKWVVLNLAHYQDNDVRIYLDNSIKENKSLLFIILTENIPQNAIVQRYAEMELLSVYDKLSQLISLIKETPNHENVKAVICDRIFGAEFDALSLKEYLNEAEKYQTITASQKDIADHFSALYISDLIDAVFTVSKYGKVGNIYNASSYPFDTFELKSSLYRLLPPCVSFKMDNNAHEQPHYSALSNGKLCSIGFKNACTKEEALRYTLSAYTQKFDLFPGFITSQYDGKLSLLRSLQLDMLREFDRICRKYAIPYFLSGGSMLGAVRHQGYIPWDDDIDVSMLREHYRKFKVVVRDELSQEYLYQNFENHNGYHYFFDRITAKNTYFATKYSDAYEMPKGISVDIFVFDNAPKNPSRFFKKLMRKRLLMNVRWKNRARKDKAYLLSKLLLPILRLKSMNSYSASYDKAVRKYEHTETGFVLPPATDHTYRGSMPKEWFSEVIPASFEGVDTFIPKGYDNYLKIWYGENYMTLLPLSLRQSYHDYYRLDTGTHINHSDKEFDYRGELL